MFKTKSFLVAALIVMCSNATAQDHQWTLQECLDYALANNIQLKQKSIATQSSHETTLQSKSALFPSVSFSASQNMSYRPFSQQTITLDGGTMTSQNDAVTANGSYGVNARWTVWNGGKNVMAIKQNQLTETQNALAEAQQANTIQEQITKLFVQILYENEAIRVCQEILKASQMQLQRAKAMEEVGQLARVDRIQLESQVAQDELNLVSAQTQQENFKLQLKQLLEIHGSEGFEIQIPEISDERVLALIPQQSTVYEQALEARPEIQSKRVAIESSTLGIKSARTGYMPTVSMNAGIGTSNVYNQQNNTFATQIKNNLSGSLGLSLSMNLFDNHETRTSIRRAKFAKEDAQLQLQDAQKQLYSSIESYYLDATTNQQKYLYARKNVQSMQESYDLVSEQFRLGLKNIVELTTGKNNLLQAQQQLLETKYTTLYNQAMLRFYQGEAIKL